MGEQRVFAVRGLLDDASLTIRGTDGADELKLESGGWHWSTAVAMGKNKKTMAWCQAGDWVEGGNKSRVSCA